MNRLDVDAPEIDIGQLGFGKGYARKAQWAAARQAPAGYPYMAGESYPIIEAVRNHLAANPGSSTPFLLEGVFGRPGATLDEMLLLCKTARIHGFGTARNGLWYFWTDHPDVRDATEEWRTPPTIEAALPLLWELRGCLRRIRIP